jgi:hypothetical protein
MDALQQILELKACYFRYLDLKQWDKWAAEVFVPDAVMELPAVRSEPLVGTDVICTYLQEVIRDATTVHHGHMPEIDITSETTARGIWRADDMIIWKAGNLYKPPYTRLHGYGYYEDNYVRTPGGWRIARTRMTRLHVDLSKE